MSGQCEREQIILLLHSLGTDSRIWDGMRRHLPGDVRVVAPDARGHGTNLGGGIDEKVWITDLDRLIDTLVGADIHLVGLSMGGVQALAYASHFAQKIASMTLANTFAYLEPEVARARVEGIGSRVATLGMARYADAYVEETVKVGLTSKGADQMRASIASIPVETYLESVRATFLADLRRSLAELTVPTLVVHAEHDQKTPRELSDYLVDSIEGARLVSIPNAGHLSAFDAPEAFADEVAAFVHGVNVKNKEVEVPQ